MRVDRRFRGPASSGNGGWTAGALAELAGHPVTSVQLRMPPPLDVAYAVAREDDWTTASYDGRTVARARAHLTDLTPVLPVDADVARAAEAAYPGHVDHPFPSCFACGTARDADGEDAGLRIFSGPGGPGSAATWTPSEVTVPITWAALDCPGGWAGDLGARLMVLGTMSARIDVLPTVGVEHVVVGEARGRDGRKTATAASLYDPTGRLLATAEHIWIAVDPKEFS